MSDTDKKRDAKLAERKRRIARVRATLREVLDKRGEPDFYCNVCHRDIRHAIDSQQHLTLPEGVGRVAGGQFRPREKCPICQSSDWVRFSVEVLRKYTDIYVSDCVTLLLAPSFGLEHALRRNRDNAITTGDMAKGRAELQLDVTHLALRNHIYDFVLCCHVLEHVRDERAAIDELKRVLAPGGQLLLSMPINLDSAVTQENPLATAKEQQQKYGRPDHVRLYGLDTADRLRAYGLAVREIVADERWIPEIKMYKLIPGDRNFLCTVPEEENEDDAGVSPPHP